jgi:general secretion pathway protein C
VQPNFTRSGRADGFKILHVNRGSFVEALGVNSGDIIKAINGTIVDSMQKGYELFNRLKNETAVDVEIIRNNETRTIHFEMR